MNYETVVTDLFDTFPQASIGLRYEVRGYGQGEPGAYIVFGSVLMPALEQALAAGDLVSILSICAFLEDVAEAAEKDLA